MFAPLIALCLLAQLPQPFAFMGPSSPPPTPTPASPTPTPPGSVVATPVIVSATSISPTGVVITESTTGATVFYTLSAGGTNPTHSGPTPLGSTKIYSGTFSTGSGAKEVRAIGYKAGLTDSAIAIRQYDPPG